MRGGWCENLDLRNKPNVRFSAPTDKPEMSATRRKADVGARSAQLLRLQEGLELWKDRSEGHLISRT